MNGFWTSPTYAVIQAMKATGNGPGLVTQWYSLLGKWAAENTGPDAEAARAWLAHYKPRPFYSAAELAPLWPALIAGLGLPDRKERPNTARLAAMLDYGKLPVLKNIDGTSTFRHPATDIATRYYITEQVHFWRKQKLSQEQFEEVIL